MSGHRDLAPLGHEWGQQTLEAKSTKAGNVTTEALYTDTALRAWKLIVAQLDKMCS